jgi:hypothetical protein
LTDSRGEPVPNVPIAWSLSQGSGSVNPQVSNTDTNGLAVANFTASGMAPSTPYVTNVIRATATTVGQEVTFFVTSIPKLAEGPGQPSILLVAPADRVINVRAGQTIPGAIAASVVAAGTAYPLPYVGMRLGALRREGAR